MKRMLSFACIMLSIFLMMFPYGVGMTFASAPGEQVIQTYSYFSPMPVGYGNVLPLLAALCSVVALILLIVERRRAMVWVTAAGALCSPVSWLIFGSFQQLSLVIVLLQAAAAGIQLVPGRRTVRKNRNAL